MPLKGAFSVTFRYEDEKRSAIRTTENEPAKEGKSMKSRSGGKHRGSVPVFLKFKKYVFDPSVKFSQ